MLAKRDCLLVLNYHRVGDKQSTMFDELVYSATADEFRQQVRYLDKQFGIVTLKDAQDFIFGRHFGQPGVLLTFDDGYIDNYTIAFPILREAGVQGTFFLVSDYLTQPAIPWWDRIAFLVRNAGQQKLRLSYPHAVEIQLSPGANSQGRRAAEIRKVVDIFKSPDTSDTKRFMAELERACEPYPPMPADQRLFLNEVEASQMAAAGMAIGSHTKTHRILSKLTEDEQVVEVSVSKAELSRTLKYEIDTLAYPVGAQSAFNKATVAALERTGYRTAFSFYGGINTETDKNRFDVKRIAVDTGNPFSRFRVQIAGAILSGGTVF